jgi:hypothetical protein
MIESGVRQVVMLDEGVKAAELAVMRERLGARNIIRGRAGFPGGREHLIDRHVDELGISFNEAPDQPRAGNAVDLRPLARNPFHEASPRTSGLHLCGMCISIPFTGYTLCTAIPRYNYLRPIITKDMDVTRDR